MIAGVLFGISASALPETRFLGVFILGWMLALEFALNRRAAPEQAIEIRRLV
jgi:hypothetical protein